MVLKLTDLVRVRTALIVATVAAASLAALGDALPDPVIWWDMESVSNGKIADKSGNGHDLSLEPGATLTNGCGGATGNALFFNGTTAASASFTCPALGSRTIAFWFRREYGSGALTYEAGNTYPYLISDLSSLRMSFSNKANERYVTGIWAQNGEQKARYFAQNIATPAVWRETWTHVAITLNETSSEAAVSDSGADTTVSHVSYKAYVNGVCVAAPATDFAITNLAVAGTAWIGNFSRNYSRPIYGAIDEFRVWDTALDAAQVASEYERARSAYGDHSAPLVGRWTFDDTETSGGSLVLKDVAGQACDITCGAGIVVTNEGMEGNAVYCNGYRACYGSFTLPDAFNNGITWACWINQSPDSYLDTTAKIGSANNAPHLVRSDGWYILGTRGAKQAEWDTRKMYLMTIGNNASETGIDKSRAPQGSWSHLAVTARFFVNASGQRRYMARFYMNGELAGTISEKDVGSAAFNTAWYFANNTVNGIRPFEGFVDDLRLYAGEVSSNTIVRLFRGAAAVSAGADFSVAGETAELHGEVGTSSPDGTRTGYAGTPRWTLVSAPVGGESAAILQPGRPITQVTLPVEGDYVFRLSNVLDDVGLERHDDVTVTRIASAGIAPSLSLVSASASGEVGIPVKLEATASSGARLHWAKVSGPGGVWFEPEGAATTMARFGAVGTYTVRCTAEKDGAAAVADATIVVAAASETCDLSSGLIDWWPLSGVNMLDSKAGNRSYSTNIQTNENGVEWTALKDGLAGYAFRPNGYSAYFALGNALQETKSTSDGNSPPTEQYRAVSAWFYHDSADTNDFKYAAIFMVPYTLGLVYNYNCSDGTADQFDLCQQGWGIGNTTVGYMHMYFGVPYSLIDRWTHIYALYDRSGGTDFELWIDGVKQEPTNSPTKRRGRVQANAYAGGIPYAANQENGFWLRAGSSTERMSRCFPGKIADLRIYNRKLTGREIKTLAANPDMAANRAPEVDDIDGVEEFETRSPSQVVMAVFDDGEPEGREMTYKWSVISGDATRVTFGDATARETTFVASRSGTYILQLAVCDGERTTYSAPLTAVVSSPGLAIIAK